MSNDDDFEQALWNNNFYSSPAVLTGLSSSNHLTNLRQTVNLPTSTLLQLLHGHVTGTLENGDVAKIPENPEKTKTSLMRVSPSMKALENALNGDSKAINQPAVIAEEDEEAENLEMAVPLFDPDHQQAGSRALALSFLTFHTAKSSDTFLSALAGPDALRRASVATLEAPAFAADDTTPKLTPLAAFSPLKWDTTPVNGPENGTNMSEPMGETVNNGTALTRTPWDSPRVSMTPKSMVGSTSCPALSAHNFQMPQTPKAEALDMGTESPRKIDHAPASFVEKPPIINSGAGSQSPRKQGPVRSLLDSPFLTSVKPSAKPPTKPPVKLPVKHAPQLSPAKSASAFATPRSRAASLKASPRKSFSDAGLPLSPSFYGHQRSATDTGAQKTAPVQEQKLGHNKRFSFRGLFKIKSKNHSLSKLKDIDEELKYGSKPVKLSAKSYSTPNMATLVQEEHENESTKTRAKAQPEGNGRKRFFGRKSFSGGDLGLVLGPTPEKKILPEETKPVEKPKKNPLVFVPPPLVSADPNTPGASSSAFSPETPLTAYLDLKRNTIREVDDSDYLPNFTKDDLPTPSAETEEENAPKKVQEQEQSSEKPASLLKEAFSDEPLHSDSASEGFSPYIPPVNVLNLPSDSASTGQFGSPFKISFPLEKPDYNPRLPMSLRYQPPQSPTRSVNSRNSNEQLVGEALFPKSLDAHEVESIVTLERSRSMRSIKSSNKRSSFLNYNGSDENIILGKNLANPNLSHGSMKRSGSILKNSPSAQSLRPDMYQLIDKTFEDESQFLSPETTEEPVKLELGPADLDFVDFIEFSDYIDFDNLDFSTSPVQQQYTEPYEDPPISEYIEYEPENNDSFVGPEESEPRTEPVDSPSAAETTSGIDTSTAIDTTGSVDNSELVKPVAEFPEKRLYEEEKPEIIPVYSNSGLDFDTSKVSSPDLKVDTANVSLDPAPNASPLDKTFKFAIDENTRTEEPDKAPRPVSMSFKGFSGSAFKNRLLPQSGSHQLIHFDDESMDDDFAVGQGFGSSDEDSEHDSDSFEEHEDEQKFHSVSGVRKGPKKMNSFDRRQQHLKHVLDLQPPSSSVPFHHDRIPSISDQSSVSSPKLLSSFISRIRKSPMPLPQIAPARPSVKFSSRIILYDTYHHDEYDRHPEIATCNQLTPLLAQQIKEELNELKSNMEVHRDSICYTQFF